MDGALAPIVRAQCGYFSRADALSAGLSDRDLAEAVKLRRIVRLRHGAYAPAELFEALDAIERHVLLARAVMGTQRGRVALTGPSAAALHGLPLYGQDLSVVHVVRLDRGSARVHAGCRHHVLSSDIEPDLEERAGLLTVGVARTVWEVARTSALEGGVCTADGALSVDPGLEEVLRLMASRFAHHPGSRTARIAIRMADGRSQSAGESITRVQCYRCGIPRPVLQHEVRDSGGRIVGISDFWWPEFRHLGEFDGKVKYEKFLRAGETPADVVCREKLREDAMRARGCGMIRLTWADVMPARARSTMDRLRHEMEQSRRLYVR